MSLKSVEVPVFQRFHHGPDFLKGDVECVTRCLGWVSSPDRVAALVYIAALVPDETETSQGRQQKFPVTDVFFHIEVADGRIWLRLGGVSAFARDLPEAEQKVVWATQAAPVPDLFAVDGVGPFQRLHR